MKTSATILTTLIALATLGVHAADPYKALNSKWRIIDGKIESTSGHDWVYFSAKCLGNHKTGVRFDGYFESVNESGENIRHKGEFFVKDFPALMADGESIVARAKLAGLYTYDTVMRSDRTIYQLDFGIPHYPTPRQPTAEELAAVDTAKKKAAAETAAKVLAWQQVQAGKGSPSAQYDLALRYQSGDGVPKDEEKARALLETSAAQDFTPAKLALKKK